VIVRIALEGQYRLADDQVPELQTLDSAVVSAADSADAEAFADRYAELLAFVRSGEPLGDSHLAPSDAILPPADVSLAQATAEISTDGLIPD
jgi:hypothetical protein